MGGAENQRGGHVKGNILDDGVESLDLWRTWRSNKEGGNRGKREVV